MWAIKTADFLMSASPWTTTFKESLTLAILVFKHLFDSKAYITITNIIILWIFRYHRWHWVGDSGKQKLIAEYLQIGWRLFMCKEYMTWLDGSISGQHILENV